MRPPSRAATRSRAVAVLAPALAAALLAACTPQDPTVTPAAEETPSTRVTAPPRADFCPVAVPQSWRDAFRDSRLPREPGERWVGLTPAPDGRSAFVTVERDGLPKVLVKQEKNGGRRQVATMPDLFTFPLWADFDGRWLVYARSDLIRAAPHSDGGAELFVWDAETGGEPRQVASARQGVVPFLLHDGKLAVTRVLGKDRAELSLHDLAAGTVRTVATGPVTAAGFRDSDLLWFDRATGRLNAIRPDGPAGPPAQPALGPGAVDVTTDGRTTAWVSRDERELTVWRPEWPAPVRVLRVTPPPPATPSLPPGARPPTVDPFHRIAGPTAVGDLVLFDYHQGWYAADLRSGSYVRLTADHAEAMVSGSALLMDPDDNSVPPERHAYSLLRLDRLPSLPACP